MTSIKTICEIIFIISVLKDKLENKEERNQNTLIHTQYVKSRHPG